MLRSRLACALVATALGIGCATGTPYNPYILSKSEFAARIHTIAVAPVFSPSSLTVPETARERIVALVLAELASHGFATVAPADVQAIRDELSGRLGGIYDPVTGKADEAKADTIHLEILRELGARYHADALLHPIVEVVVANFSNSWANWCGARQEVFPPTDNFFAWLFVGSQVTSASGTVPASCLIASIDEISGLEIYEGHGGIEVVRTFDGKDFESRPPEELFADAARIEAAVKLAVGTLPMQGAAAPSPP